MTVGELIDKLSEYDRNMRVAIDGAYYNEIVIECGPLRGWLDSEILAPDYVKLSF